ncbi:MAG: IPT/TIG domain-containing protein [Rhodoluna sp.]|nr:IPT/TIG domain-containing protein [Rhodoluna sp.]
MGKQYSGSNAKVNVGNVASVGEQNKTVTGVTGSDGRVTFSMVNTDVAADAANNPGTNLGANFSGKKLFTQATAWVTSQTQDSIDLVDFIFFKPADAPVTKTVVSRVVGADASNAWISEGEGWYSYYAAGVRYMQRGIEVGKTTSLSFAVTADGAPYANKTVKLLLGKTYSGSSAKVAVNGTAFPGVGDEKVIELTTNANGIVSFDVSNSNFSADADPYQAANLKNPEGSKKLFVQIAVVGEKGNQDILDIIDLFYYKAQAAAPATIYNARLADWDASNSFDGTKVWGDAGLADGWFDVHTGYFAHYVKAGSTFNLRYKVTNAATGANAPDGTVVTVTLGAAWSSSNAKFTSGSTVIDGKTKWGANGQLDQGSVTATVVNGIATVSLTSNDVAEDATINPGSATANPDTLSPLFMQAKIKVEGNAITRQDWVNIVVTQAPSAPTISAVSSTTGKRGQAIDIVGTNLGDALGNSVILYTAPTTKVAAISTPVTVLSVNAAGTRMTVRSPSATQKGTFRVTNSAGTASAPAAFTASSTATSKPTITMTASVVKEVGSEITLSGTNLASATSITIGSVNAPFSIVNATTVVITVPAGVVSGSKISATNAGGTTTTSKFVYQAAVVATTTAAAKVGQTVTITGSNLVASSVVFGGNKSAKPVINNGSTLTVVVPTGALTGLIKITTGAGVVYTKSFTVTPPTPTVTSFTPTTGKKGVTVVSVKGTNLTGATVTIGSTPVTVSAGASSTSLKFVIPAGATSGKITVTTGGGSATSASTLTIN